MVDTTKLKLEPYAIRHVEALYAAAIESSNDLYPFMQWYHPNYRIDESRKFVTSQIAEFAAQRAFEFAIVSPEGTYLGSCGLNQIDQANRRANLGYWVRTSAAGRGIATAAVKKLALWAWTNTNLNRLEIIVSTENTRSARVAEKAGAVFEGILRARLLLHGRAHDTRVYSLIRPVL